MSYYLLFVALGGEGGIRTPDTLASMPHFECGAFNHSATSPEPPHLAPGPWHRKLLCCKAFLEWHAARRRLQGTIDASAEWGLPARAADREVPVVAVAD